MSDTGYVSEMMRNGVCRNESGNRLEELPRPGEHEDDASVDGTTAAAILPENVANAATPFQPIDLYDSRASHHMSPHRQDFASLSEAKMMLNATNQQTFRAKGVGEMVIPVPNPPGADMRIRLNLPGAVIFTSDRDGGGGACGLEY